MPNGESERSIDVSLILSGASAEIETWVQEGLDGIGCTLHRVSRLPEVEQLASTLPAQLDPDLALVVEESAADFPARLKAFKALHPRCQILFFGGEDSELSPRRLRPLSIRHWFFQPIDGEDVRRVLRAAGLSLRRQLHEEHRRSRDLPGFEAMVGMDAGMVDVLELARKVAQSPGTSVLLLGETGSGKSLLARTIHRSGPRRNGPLIDINCGAIPANLLESELFGYAQGAFTDAKKDKPGLLELADGGTAFLDEVGELTPELQVKLLKFLDSGELRRVAGRESVKVDVRVIAATNRDLDAEVQAGRFRLDLYHRLNVVSLRLPPLRERPHDIEALARYHLELFARRLHGTTLELSREALDALCRYAWPGNVRQLINCMERTALLLEGPGPVRPADLPIEVTPRAAVCETEEHGNTPLVRLPEGGISLEEIERAFLAAALERARGNVTEAARLLRMSRGSFRYQMEKLGLRNRAGGRRGRPRKRRLAA